MAWFLGEDRNGRITRLVGSSVEPLTIWEFELVQHVRCMEDMKLRSQSEPNWDREAAEQLELSQRVAAQHIIPPSEGWVVLNPEEASLVKDALEYMHLGLSAGSYKRDCWDLIVSRFENVR